MTRGLRSALFGLVSLATQAFAAPAASSLGYDDARHLLTRTGFGASESEIRTFATLTREQAVDRLLKSATSRAATPAPAWVNEPIVPPARFRDMSEEQRAANRKLEFERGIELREWWAREMATTASPLTERMTLFWHNHFATSQRKVRYSRPMYEQNVLLRSQALGNFGVLLRHIARDPAMLVYLDGAQNRKEKPNENFAREVMELFTLGEGHYTEADIKEAARAFTGLSVDPENGEFRWRPGAHDAGVKQVLGTSGNFQAEQVLDLLLARPETAEFITRKLWREFVSPSPDESEVKRLAGVFRDARYEVKPLLRAMLLSDAFWSAEHRAVLIKSPTDLVVGTLHTLEMKPDDYRAAAIVMAQLGQNLFSPPNVKGWPGGESWINSATLLRSKAFMERLMRGEGPTQGFEIAQIGEMSEMRPRDRRIYREFESSMRGMNLDLAMLDKALPANVPKSQSVPKLLLAAAPHRAVDSKADLAALVRKTVLDPVYQLR